jgi:hypothetical protein
VSASCRDGVEGSSTGHADHRQASTGKGKSVHGLCPSPEEPRRRLQWKARLAWTAGMEEGTTPNETFQHPLLASPSLTLNGKDAWKRSGGKTNGVFCSNFKVKHAICNPTTRAANLALFMSYFFAFAFPFPSTCFLLCACICAMRPSRPFHRVASSANLLGRQRINTHTWPPKSKKPKKHVCSYVSPFLPRISSYESGSLVGNSKRQNDKTRLARTVRLHTSEKLLTLHPWGIGHKTACSAGTRVD